MQHNFLSACKLFNVYMLRANLLTKWNSLFRPQIGASISRHCAIKFQKAQGKMEEMYCSLIYCHISHISISRCNTAP
jgi:hypothetical protein